MCGIAGVWCEKGVNFLELRARVGAMAKALAHRGPDDSGVWSDPSCGIALSHTRLAIIDLSAAGKQPMAGPSERTRITFNGEIYNYLELRSELAVPLQGSNHSDTYVIPALYEQYGLDCLKKLRGMFAFGLWDENQKRLILARDRVGKKPLYYYRKNGAFLFASEIKAILAAVHDSVTIDADALDEYLSYGRICGERTIYREIRELLPGHFLVGASPSEFVTKQYWNAQWQPKLELSFASAVDEADARINEAVKIRLRSDVPVGAFLSGGIDSGIIAALAAKNSGHRLQTFCLGFSSDDMFDERALAKQVAERYNTEHHEVILRPDLGSMIPKIARQYDEPFADASAFPSFVISEFASSHVKVVLNGDGGDELFGGYRRHIAAKTFAQISRWVPAKAMRSVAAILLRGLPRSTSHRTPYSLALRFIRGLAAGERERFLSWSTDGFTALEKQQLAQPPWDSFGGRTQVETLLESLSGLGKIDQALAVDLLWGLPNSLLVKMDMATMAHGLEARSPLLDHELIDWTNLLPESVRLAGTTTKPLLRELARRYLPPDIVNAPKRGFEIPVYRWLKNDLKEMRDDLILSPNGIACSIFGRANLEQILYESQDTPARWARKTWYLLMLAAWERYAAPDVTHSKVA